jgi:cupin superfamily acireductone dioxygenase involved in methionine salvage
MSNAVTKVTIADVEMTVADAIERKTSIVYEQTLLNTLKRQTMNSKSTVATENQKVEIRLDQQLNQMFGNDNVSAKTSEGAIAYAKEFRNQNEFELIDPLSIDKEIEKLEKGIDDFLSEVDYVLSTSNALTEIEIE